MFTVDSNCYIRFFLLGWGRTEGNKRSHCGSCYSLVQCICASDFLNDKLYQCTYPRYYRNNRYLIPPIQITRTPLRIVVNSCICFRSQRWRVGTGGLVTESSRKHSRMSHSVRGVEHVEQMVLHWVKTSLIYRLTHQEKRQDHLHSASKKRKRGNWRGVNGIPLNPCPNEIVRSVVLLWKHLAVPSTASARIARQSLL